MIIENGDDVNKNRNDTIFCSLVVFRLIRRNTTITEIMSDTKIEYDSQIILKSYSNFVECIKRHHIHILSTNNEYSNLFILFLHKILNCFNIVIQC